MNRWTIAALLFFVVAVLAVAAVGSATRAPWYALVLFGCIIGWFAFVIHDAGQL